MTVLFAHMRGLFADNRRFWTFSAFFFGGLALLKGFRRPNDWSATQAQVDYRFGFVKRGLFGAVFTGPLHLNHRARFAAFSLLLLLLLMTMLATFVVKSGAVRRLGDGEIVALFFASYSVTYLAHTVGYFDILEAVAAIAVLLIRHPARRLALAVPVCIAALMVHELFLFVFVPVILFSFVLQGLMATNHAARTRRFVEGSVVLLVSIGAALVVALQSSLAPAQVERMRDSIAGQVDFPVRQDFFAVMTRSAGDNLVVMRTFYRSGPWLQEQAMALLLFLPTLVLLLVAIHKVLAKAQDVPASTTRFATLAAVSPFAMYLLGWDGERWQALAVFTAFLTLLTVCTFTAGAQVPLSKAFRNAMIFTFALSMGSGGLLMDCVQPRFFPFEGSQAGRAVRMLLRSVHR